MADARLLRLGPPRRPRPRLAERADYPAALAFCQGRGADGVMAGHRLGQAVARPAGGEVWILEQPGARRLGQGLRPEHIKALIWAGGSLMPVGADSAAAESLAPVVRRRGGHYVSIVGDQAAVAALWAGLSSAWPAPRAYRPNQPLMALGGPGRIEPDPAVRPATPDLLEAIVPACRAMFTEELGFAPPGPEMGYRAHVANQIERGNMLARLDPASGLVVFKAELGAACGPWVQIQGVWTDPAYRGRGIAKAGLAAVVAHARRRGWTHVCLYVNDFNAAALAVYRALGFIQVGTWATVML